MRPDADEFMRTPTGLMRDREHAIELADKEWPRRFRSLGNYIKAVMDAADTGIIEADDALLPFLILPGGQTVAERAQVQLEMVGDVDLAQALPAGRSDERA